MHKTSKITPDDAAAIAAVCMDLCEKKLGTAFSLQVVKEDEDGEPALVSETHYGVTRIDFQKLIDSGCIQNGITWDDLRNEGFTVQRDNGPPMVNFAELSLFGNGPNGSKNWRALTTARGTTPTTGRVH